MDVRTDFLNGELEEEIYIEQPEECIVPGKEKKVCRSSHTKNKILLFFLYRIN